MLSLTYVFLKPQLLNRSLTLWLALPLSLTRCLSRSFISFTHPLTRSPARCLVRCLARCLSLCLSRTFSFSLWDLRRQELLAFLLNGLNEDLNRIADKPYIEQPDSDGRSDAELADIWWKNHLRREFSIVVALFAGQFKSLLACRECGYESARFEPFMFLQVWRGKGRERYSMIRYGSVRVGMIRHGTVRHGTIRYNTVRYGTVRYGKVM